MVERKLYSENSKTNYSGEKESEYKFINDLKEGKTRFPNIIYGRMSEFCGIIHGWIPEKDDVIFSLEDSVLSKNATEIADDFSASITDKEPYYKYSFPPRGPAIIGPWIFTFLLSYGLGKGLDYLLKKLKEPELKKMANDISIDWNDYNGDSLGQVNVSFKDGNSFSISRYPQSIDEITSEQIERALKVIDNKSKYHITYDSWGKISVSKEFEGGHFFNIEI